MAGENEESMLVPGTFDVQSAAIARKRKLLEAMVGRAKMGEGRMVGNNYVAPHWLEGVAELGAAWKAKKANKALDDQTIEMNRQHKDGLGEAVQNYLDTRNGSTKTVETQGPTQDGSELPPHEELRPADPRRAIVEAMTSDYGQLQKVGAADFAQLGKSTAGLTQKDYLSLTGFDPRSRVAAAMNSDPNLLQPENKTHVVNNRLVRESGDSSNVMGDFSDTYNPVGQIGVGSDGKPIMGQTEKRTGKAAFAPGAGATVNVDTGKKGAEAMGVEGAQLVMKNLGEGAAAAKKAQQGYEIFRNANTLMGDVKGGSGANLILGAKKIAQQLGVTMDPSITSTEQVGAALGQAVLDNAKALGTGNGFTDKDREFLEKIVMGKITLDGASLQRAVNLGMTSNLNVMRNHAKQLKKANDIRGADPAILSQLEVEIPEFHLDDEAFSYDHKTDRFGVKGNTPVAPPPLPGTPAVSVPHTLTPAEQSELAALRLKHKGGK
jgi:hypothetical protein